MLLPLTAGCAAGGAPADKVPAGQQVSYNDGKTLDQALTGLVPGKPVSCLPLNPSPPSSGYGSTILYRYSAKRIYRNDLGPGCEGIGRGDILVTSNPIGRSCRGDIIRTVDRTSGITTGGCAFNDFTPYEAPR
ncbi:hypothetical protein Q5H91_00795 [Sphingomonas sp. KR1UV-12]|uniref:Lipoprotein n=1 Tax=Sphingomonas aurea TaxID=3063994 RepID=A0ABT9EFK5_9SPHN|nr:hypothetical protein [Sphingomonas sp. KR1UV-12]MDP1025739.1 hypothetical protein [Sphingomonas sp. KR1UV-12]